MFFFTAIVRCRKGKIKMLLDFLGQAAFLLLVSGLFLFAVVLVWNCQLCASFCSTGCQYTTTVLCRHSLTETVLVLSLSVRGLECSFHRLYCFYVYYSMQFAIRLAKLDYFFKTTKYLSRKIFCLWNNFSFSVESLSGECCCVSYLMTAMTSTSTSTSLGRVFAATQERAGLLVNVSP